MNEKEKLGLVLNKTHRPKRHRLKNRNLKKKLGLSLNETHRPKRHRLDNMNLKNEKCYLEGSNLDNIWKAHVLTTKKIYSYVI